MQKGLPECIPLIHKGGELTTNSKFSCATYHPALIPPSHQNVSQRLQMNAKEVNSVANYSIKVLLNNRTISFCPQKRNSCIRKTKYNLCMKWDEMSAVLLRVVIIDLLSTNIKHRLN